MNQTSDKEIYLIYDGECPVCNKAAQILKIQQSIGKLQIINARSNHQLVKHIKKLGYDLNEGILVIFQDKYYHGKDAMNLLAMIGSPSDLLNKINIVIFRSKILTSIFYPLLKFIRNSLLFLLKIEKINMNNNELIFKKVFGDSWEMLPKILKTRYSNKPYSNDIVLLNGTMDIKFSRFIKFIQPLLKFAGALVPYEGKNVPTIINIKSEINSNYSILERHFNFLYHPPFIFSSKFVQMKDNLVVEIVKFGFGICLNYSFDGKKVLITHNSYVLNIFGLFIPIPLSILLGKVYAEEQEIDINSYSMKILLTHKWFGDIFEYNGKFTN
jgi:predicted DCC family thiol-disulfide oxidoreductase YuxK